MVYDVLPLWSPPGQAEPYSSRYQWPRHGSYEEPRLRPANALGALAGRAHLRYVEVKAAIGGVTAIQGSAKMAYPYEGWLVRNVEYETFKTGVKTVFQSALPLKDAEDYGRYRDHMKAGSAFIYHLSEGTDPALIEEYELARARKLLRPRFCGIHCTALGAPEFGEWGRIAEDIDGAEDVEGEESGTLVWSPFSNLWLYRGTTDVATARNRGMRVCLGAAPHQRRARDLDNAAAIPGALLAASDPKTAVHRKAGVCSQQAWAPAVRPHRERPTL